MAKRILSEDKLRVIYNLRDILDRAYKDEAVKRELRKSITNNRIKAEFGERVILKIQERTSSGKNIDGEEFDNYSPEYAKRKGVGRGDVDLVLSGRMMAGIRTSNYTNANVSIYMLNRQSPKAHGHVTGGNYLPVRDFFGITEEDEVKILKEVLQDLNKEDEAKQIARGMNG